ncbi:MAG: zf-TFIIB domain-containing protein [Anaerolineae bacterium]
MGASRLCVKCRQVELQDRQMGQVVAGSCPRCHGLWFGRGSLDLALNQPGLSAAIAAREPCCPVCNIPVTMEAPRCAGCGATLHRLECPDGDGRLKQVHVGGIIVEVCPLCDGVFLDRGELSKVNQAAQAVACAACGEPLPSPEAGYLVSRGRICSRCFRKRAAKQRDSEERIDDVLDSMLDTFFWGRRLDRWF